MKIYGTKAGALFDRWSLAHIAFYGLVTELFLIDFSFFPALLILITLGYLWELLEKILENLDHKKIIFKEREGWLNRYVGDMLSNVAGFLLAWFVF